MTELYVKYIDGNFYKADLKADEPINYKVTIKDLTDITKIWSPYTQSFTLDATDKNKMLFGFIGNEKIARINNAGEFTAMIYVGGFIFQSGILSFSESNYKLLDQKDFKMNFANNLTALNQKLGDTTIQDLFANDDLSKIDWSVMSLKNNLSSVKNITLANGIELKYGIPFISNVRAWTYDEENLSTTDNIAFNKNRTAESVNFINLAEVRPAISYMTIMKHLLLKIGTPVICPLFEKSEVKDAFAWCSSADLTVPNATSYQLKNFDSIIPFRHSYKHDSGAVDVPKIANVKWQITGDLVNGIFKAKRNNATSGEQGGWSDGFDVNVIFNNLVSLDGNEIKIKVNLIRNNGSVILDSQEISGNTFVSRITDTRAENPTMLDENGEIFLRVEILPLTIVKWDSIDFKIVEKFNYTRTSGFPGTKRTARATYEFTSKNTGLSSTLGGNKFNLISALPKMKCVDFLKSFFNTFGINVISTGKQDQSMYWITQNDIKEVNKPYSKRIVDWTNYVDIANLNKKKGNQYNQYLFTHFDSKYFEAVYGDGTKYGSLSYPDEAPEKPTKFTVETKYSIIKQAVTFSHPSTAKACLGFQNATPEILSNGGLRYKPVYDEFTLFYLQKKSLGLNTVSVQYSDKINSELFSVLEASPVNNFNGKSLTFGDGDSLFLNYYSDFIQHLLREPYKSEFNLSLPPNEIFMNEANLNQNESNIPTGYRPQNEIIIGEQRYLQQDFSVDMTSGKAKLTALNF